MCIYLKYTFNVCIYITTSGNFIPGQPYKDKFGSTIHGQFTQTINILHHVFA